VGGTVSPTDASHNCEEYSISKDKWTILPDFPLKICSNTLMTIKNYLYSIGGIVKINSQLNLIPNIYRLEVGSEVDQWASWEEMPVTLY
jgi:N-acetylneuraminic acid mutarotase